MTRSQKYLPNIVSRDERLATRKEPLAKEKEATRACDTLRAERQALPMVEIGERYSFEGLNGAPTAGLPPHVIYRVTPTMIFGFGTDETLRPTRWCFRRELVP